MARRTGRPSLPYLRAEIKVSIAATIAAEIDLLLSDPLTGKPKYGARATLVSALLENWLAKQKGKPEAPLPTIEQLRA